MHAETAGLEGEYYRRRCLLGPVDRIGYRTLLGEISLAEAASRVLDAQPCGGSAPRQARAEAQAILAVLAQPGDFLALSNGDPCPYNCLISNGTARLFDFELAGYRHALLDVAYLHLGFQWCYQPGRMPDVLREAETAYRLEAGSGISLTLDEPGYQRALATAAAAWAMLAGGMVVRHLDRGGTFASDDAARQVATMREYVALSGRTTRYPTLSHWITELVSAFDHEQPTGQRGLYRPFD
jgi:hypothetical protein